MEKKPGSGSSESGKSSNSSVSYDPCGSNPALGAKGCLYILNGQIVTSNGDGTIVTSAGNIFDANGRLVGTTQSSTTVTQPAQMAYRTIQNQAATAIADRNTSSANKITDNKKTEETVKSDDSSKDEKSSDEKVDTSKKDDSGKKDTDKPETTSKIEGNQEPGSSNSEQAGANPLWTIISLTCLVGLGIGIFKVAKKKSE